MSGVFSSARSVREEGRDAYEGLRKKISSRSASGEGWLKPNAGGSRVDDRVTKGRSFSTEFPKNTKGRRGAAR